MDHLPWRDQLPRGRPEVPFLCADSEDDICNDIDDFICWPALRGWDLASSTISETAKWCQAWFFFGFLRILTESLGRTFRVEAYVSEHNGRVLDSRPIAELITAFRRKFSYRASSKRSIMDGFLEEPHLRHFARTICKVLGETLRAHSTWIIRTLQQYEAQYQTPDPWTSDLFNVFWSSLLLFELFCDLHPNLRNDRGIDGVYSALPLISRKTRTISGAFLIFGRCPTVLNRVGLSPMKAYRLLAIPIPRNTDHKICQFRHCKTLDVDRQNYQIQHDEQCRGRCSTMQISLQGLESIIENNLIPIVRSTIDASGILTIELVARTEIQDYAAISHIWARGLGNFDKNAHFECQLRQLHIDLFSQNKRRSGSVHYWIDTLCIPLQDGHLKKKAINSMAAIYAGARHILVIDSELRLVESRTLESQEINLAILCSPWMARSWTFQEGALGVKVYIKFKDGLVLLADLGRRIKLTERILVQGLWKRDVNLVDSDRMFGTDITPHDSPRENFLAAWNELCNRCTTKCEDIAAILAVFLNLSAGEVLDLPPERRIQALLRTQKFLPTSILFSPIDTGLAEWSPVFPSSNIEGNSLDPKLGYLRFLDNGRFLLSDVRGIKALLCNYDIVICGSITVYDEVGNCYYHVNFDESTSKNAESVYTDVLLLFAPCDTDMDGISEGKGISCITRQKHIGGLQAQFLKRFTWMRDEAECSTNNIDLYGHAISPRYTHTTPYRIASPIDESNATRGYCLSLDMGVQSWPHLKWARQDFYPFLQTSIRIAQPLKLFKMLELIFYVYVGFYAFVMKPAEFVYQASYRKAVIFPLIGIVYIRCRRYLASIEHRYFRKWSHRTLQTKWAASFRVPASYEDGQSSRNTRITRRIVFIILIYSTLVISSVAGSIVFWLHRGRSSICPGSGPSPVYSSSHCLVADIFGFVFLDGLRSLLLALLKLVCFTVSIESLCRIIFIILFYRPWKAKAVPEDIEYRKDKWRMNAFLLLTFAVFVGVFTVFLIVTESDNYFYSVLVHIIFISVGVACGGVLLWIFRELWIKKFYGQLYEGSDAIHFAIANLYRAIAEMER